MDELGAWIFTIGIVLFAIAGSVLKALRRARRVHKAASPRLEELIAEAEQMYQTDQQSSATLVMPEEKQRVRHGKKQVAHPVSKKPAPAMVADDEETTEPIVDFTDTEEVKKAVIASEILNRKY